MPHTVDLTPVLCIIKAMSSSYIRALEGVGDELVATVRLILQMEESPALVFTPEQHIRLRREIAQTLQRIFIEAARIAGQGKAKAQLNFPGYVTFSGGSLHIPYNLALGLPGLALVKDLSHTAALLRVCRTGKICLSGSSAFFPDGLKIGDIDYFEYLDDENDDLFVRSPARSRRLAVPYQLKLWLANQRSRPDRIPPMSAGHAYKFDRTGVEKGMVYWILDTNRTGVAEATNLFSTPARANEITFVFQEVQIGHAVEPGPRLFEPPYLAAYVKFLRNEIDKYLGADPSKRNVVKAAKRALALGRLLLRDTTEIYRALISTGTANAAALKARLEIKTDELPPEVLNRLQITVRRMMKKLKPAGKADLSRLAWPALKTRAQSLAEATLDKGEAQLLEALLAFKVRMEEGLHHGKGES